MVFLEQQFSQKKNSQELQTRPVRKLNLTVKTGPQWTWRSETLLALPFRLIPSPPPHTPRPQRPLPPSCGASASRGALCSVLQVPPRPRGVSQSHLARASWSLLQVSLSFSFISNFPYFRYIGKPVILAGKISLNPFLVLVVIKQRFESFASGARQLYFLTLVMLGIVLSLTNAIHTNSSKNNYVEVTSFDYTQHIQYCSIVIVIFTGIFVQAYVILLNITSSAAIFALLLVVRCGIRIQALISFSFQNLNPKF